MNHYPHHISDFVEMTRVRKLPAVYVLSTPDFEYIKIGKTKSLKQRLINIQSGCPFVLRLWIAVRTPKYHEIEKVALLRLSHCHVRGEWFAPSPADLDDLANFFALTNKNVREVSALLQAKHR